MDYQMPVIYILVLSITAQAAAAVMAFRLIAVTGRKTAWLLISSALTLMAVRRIIPLYRLISGDLSVPTDPLNESIGLVLSMAMAFGIARIAPLFIERLHAEKALRESEQRLAQAQRIAHIGHWELDLVNNVLLWSDEIYRIFEIDPGRFGASYEAFLNAIHPDDRPAVDDAYTNSVKDRAPYTIDHRLLFADGRVKFVREQCETYYDQDGSPLRSLGTVQDITDQKMAEEALRRSNQRNEMILNSAGEGIYGTDIDGDIMFMNPAAQEMLGFRSEDLIGKNSHQTFHHTSADGKPYPMEECPLYKSLKEGESYRGQDEVFWARDGRMFYVEHVNTPLIENGGVVGAVAVFRDITERRKAEEEIRMLTEELEQRVAARTAELKKKSQELEDSQSSLMNIVEDLNEKTAELKGANEKLQELDRMKSMFIATMSHELRTPLNSIIGFSSITLDEWIGPLNAEQKENLATILRSGKHLLSLINDVIDVSKIESGRIEVSYEDLDLYDVISEAVGLFKKDLQDKGLDLKVEPIHLAMHTDRRRLLQCVVNLISNAVKFTERGSVQIEVKKIRSLEDEKTLTSQPLNFSTSADFVEISVSDTGIGIKEEDMSRLFGAFVRLHSAEVMSVKGTGLGLYLTKKIVTDILKGEITAESEYGKGSRFVIRIPVKCEKGAENEESTGNRRQSG